MYGIKQIREALLALTVGEACNVRITKLLSELDAIEHEDVTPEHVKQIQEIRQEWMDKDRAFIDSDGNLETDSGGMSTLYSIAESIVNLWI